MSNCRHGAPLNGVCTACKVFGTDIDPTSVLSLMTNKYNELISAVETKHPGESRHQTALRYIKQAEAPSVNAAAGDHE
tara:strand:+ start:60350 stop:60583 length:234 start_codon:yes stop_codon:yes gene_type:complete